MRRLLALLGPLALAFGGCGDDGGQATDAERSEDAVPANALEGGPECVTVFSLEGLSDRAFAFDGTVTEVLSEVDPKLEDDGSGVRPQPRARFEVAEWFAGGSEPTVLVWLEREVSVGDRLLVSGQPRWGGEPLDDAIQWECGWTVEHSDSAADAWRDATAA